MRVLITGAGGFIGRNFVRRLLADKHEIIGVDIRASTLQLGFHQFIDDVRRYVMIAPAAEFDLIIHCAANVGGRLNIDGDPLGVATNLGIDADVINWVCKAESKPYLVYFSSSAIYPPELQTRTKHLALMESLVDFSSARFALPETTYGFCKFAGEYLVKQAVDNHGARIVVYRPFGGYGSDQDLTYPFPSIIQRVLRRENPIVVWGSGDQERDFIHVDDIVEAVLLTYDKLPAGRPLNLGTGNGISFKRLAELACVVAGHRATIEADTSKPEGVFSRVADTYQLDQWHKTKISLAEGIERALTANGQ